MRNIDIIEEIPEFRPDPNQGKAVIKDSGARRSFQTGAVRDVNEQKGRCDLLPLRTVALAAKDDILLKLYGFLSDRSTEAVMAAINDFMIEQWGGIASGLLELSIHFEDGAKKYDERNWEKGIPLHSFLDSALRHYFKFRRGDRDEPHDRAFVWNLFCMLWTYENKPELDDLPKY